MRFLFIIFLMGKSLGFSFEKENIDGIEFFLEKPKEQRAFPAVILIHGYQPEQNSQGGKEWQGSPIYKNLLSENIVPVAISIPGFGGSKGDRDYCGPIAQNAVITLIAHLKTLPYIDESKIGIVGGSRGAITAAMVSTQYQGLAFQALFSGKYDLSDPFPIYFQGINENFLRESKGNWMDRSAVYHAEKIKTPTLILHGALDPLGGTNSAQKLHSALIDKEVFSRFILFPKLDHFIATEREVISYLSAFLLEQFYDKYGIGISLSPTNCYPQINGILSGYPAEKSHLQLGDIILEISPNNDGTMISALDMPAKDLTKLILGKKGSKLKLKVAHLDGFIEEEVTINRMK